MEDNLIVDLLPSLLKFSLIRKRLEFRRLFLGCRRMAVKVFLALSLQQSALGNQPEARRKIRKPWISKADS